MKKLQSFIFAFVICVLLVLPLSSLYAEDKVCTDILVNLARGAESSSVLTLQNFLSQKGYLKAKPNGYYGPGTVAAVKLFQKSVGIVQTGSTYTLTRAALKKQTCGVVQTSTTMVSPTNPKVITPKVPQVNQAALDAMSLVNTLLPPSMFLDTASTTQPRPTVTSVNPSAFVTGGALTAPFVISGTGFSTTSETNVVTIKLQGGSGTAKAILLGTYGSATGTMIVATSGVPTMTTSCGDGCVEKLPTGNYDVVVKNAGGESNAGTLSIKGFFFTAQSATNSNAIRQKASSTKFGTLSFSSSLPGVLQDIKVTTLKANFLTISSSSILLPTFITNMTLTDELAGGIKTNNGETFASTTRTLTENQTKIFTIFGDVDSVLPMSAIFEAVITMKDQATGNTVKVTSPQFSVTISD